MQDEINTCSLAELEAKILDYYLAKGYKLEKDQTENDESWIFEVNIATCHKEKQLYVIFSADGKEKTEFYTLNTTTKEMFDAAFEFFKDKGVVDKRIKTNDI